MTRKLGGRDRRQEPDGEDGDEDSSQRFRVDRVFAAPRRATSPTATPAVSDVASAPKVVATGTSSGIPVTKADPELALRHQLSKVQRQLADAQRLLAEKEAELATEVEHRLLITAARDKLLEEQQRMEELLLQAGAAQTRAAELERQLADSLASTQELAVLRERERTARAASEAKVEELVAAMEDARVRRIDERAAIEERHADELARLDGEHQAAIATVREAHDRLASEVEELRRGAEAGVAVREERDRLVGELEQLRREEAERAEARRREAEMLEEGHRRALAEQAEAHNRALAEQAEAHGRALAEQAESHGRALAEQADAHRRALADAEAARAAQIAELGHAHAAELSRVIGERDAEILEHQRRVRDFELETSRLSQALAQLREAHDQLETDLAEADKNCARLDAERIAAQNDRTVAVRTVEQLQTERQRLIQQLDADRRAHEAEREALREQLEAERARVATERARVAEHLEQGLALLRAAPGAADRDPAGE